MIRFRVILIAVAALALFAWQDVMLWQRIFERGELWQYAGTYHDGWRVMRDALVIVGAALLWPRMAEMVFYAGTLFLFSVNGFVDLLYFWLDGKPLPAWLEWNCDAWHICALPGPLKGPAVVVNVVVFALVWGAAWWAIARVGVGFIEWLGRHLSDIDENLADLGQLIDADQAGFIQVCAFAFRLNGDIELVLTILLFVDKELLRELLLLRHYFLPASPKAA